VPGCDVVIEALERFAAANAGARLDGPEGAIRPA
jgi:hypothetical protein